MLLFNGQNQRCATLPGFVDFLLALGIIKLPYPVGCYTLKVDEKSWFPMT